MDKDTKKYIVVDDIFRRYTVVLGITSQKTSAYCEECDQWVFELDGDHLSTHTTLELFEFIVSRHDEQKHGVFVEIADPSKPLDGWD